MAIEHIVLFKFAPDASADDIARFVEELNRMPEFNPEIMDWRCGPPPRPLFHNGDFDLGLSCLLADARAMDRYMSNDGHLRMAQFFAAVVDGQISFDFEVPDPEVRPAGPAVRPDADADQIPAGLVGLRLAAATELIESSGRRVGKVAERPSPYWAEGFVLSGRDADDGAVDLLVSSTTRVGIGELRVVER